MRIPIIPIGIFLSVTVISVFIQSPVAAETRLLRSSLVDDLPAEVVSVPTVPEEVAGRSFYPDYLLRWSTDPSLLMVVTADLPREIQVGLIQQGQHLGDDAPAILLVAPRHNRADAGRIAAALTEIPTGVPRIFLDQGQRTEWVVSVPDRVTPLGLTRALANHTIVSVNSAELNAAHLGFGRADPALEEALRADTAAARLVVTEPSELYAAVETLSRALREASSDIAATDRNYLLLPLHRPLIVSEIRIVQGLIGLAVLLLLYSLILPRRVLHYLRSIGHNVPALLISLAAIVISLMAANISLRLVGRIPRISPSPLLLAAGKIAFATLVLSTLAAVLGHRIRRATAVYSGAAVLFLMVGAIISSAVSVILGAYFTVSFLFGVLFSLGRTVWIKSLTLLCAIAPVLYLVLALAPAADRSMATALLTPPLIREFVTAVMLLPILLMFFRLDTITPRTPLLPILAMVATVGFSVVTASLIVQVRDPEPRELFVVERYTRDSAEREVTPGPTGPGTIAGPVTVRTADSRETRCDSLPCSESATIPDPPLRLEVERSQALDRHTVRWTVTFHELADTVQVSIESSGPVQLYATDLPVHQPVGSRGNRFTFDTGPMPPETVEGSTVLRSDAVNNAVTVTVSARFPGEAFTADSGFSVTHRGRTWTLTETVALEN